MRSRLLRPCCFVSQVLNRTGFGVCPPQPSGIAACRTPGELHILSENLDGLCTGRRARDSSYLANNNSTIWSGRNANGYALPSTCPEFSNVDVVNSSLEFCIAPLEGGSCCWSGGRRLGRRDLGRGRSP